MITIPKHSGCSQVRAFIFGLMICGVPDYSRTTWFSGANVNDEITVRES